MICRVCREGAGAMCDPCRARIQGINEGAGTAYIPLNAVDVRGVWPTYINGTVAVSLDGKDRSISYDDAQHVANHMLANRVTLR